MAEQSTCGMILLAAGASQRMGRPKQLLPIQGKPLVRHVVENVLPAGFFPVVVVLGACAGEVQKVLEGLPVVMTVNPGWAEGMGSSLRAGVATALRLQPGLKGLIVALADQPDLRAMHVEQIAREQRRTGQTMVAWECEGVPMPPVFFGVEHFQYLLALPGDTGARALLRSAGAALAVVHGETLTDLDTPADYEVYMRSTKIDSQQ